MENLKIHCIENCPAASFHMSQGAFILYFVRKFPKRYWLGFKSWSPKTLLCANFQNGFFYRSKYQISNNNNSTYFRIQGWFKLFVSLILGRCFGLRRIHFGKMLQYQSTYSKVQKNSIGEGRGFLGRVQKIKNSARKYTHPFAGKYVQLKLYHQRQRTPGGLLYIRSW